MLYTMGFMLSKVGYFLIFSPLSLVCGYYIGCEGGLSMCLLEKGINDAIGKINIMQTSGEFISTNVQLCIISQEFSINVTP